MNVKTHNLKNIEKNIDFLKKLKNKKSQKNILKNCTNKNMQAICECITPKNILLMKKRNLINKKALKSLKQHKKYLSLLLQKKTLKTRKEILKQNGGFLPFLIPIAIKVATMASLAAKAAGAVATGVSIAKAIKNRKPKK